MSLKFFFSSVLVSNNPTVKNYCKNIIVAFLNFLYFILFFPIRTFLFFSFPFSSFFLLHTFPLSLSSLFLFSFYLHLSGAFLLSSLSFFLFFSSISSGLWSSIFNLHFSFFFFLFFSSTTSTPEHSRSTIACPLPTKMGQLCSSFFWF